MGPFDILLKLKGKKKWEKREREVRMLECGARLLQELITSCDGKVCYPIRIVSAEEIMKATDGFSNHMHDWGGYDYYKGTYQDHPILVKRFKEHEDWNDDFAFNEIVMLHQVNHRNVVKILGCCFEMEMPILIYESVPNGNLSSYIESNPSCPISWENRLRIATEIADAVTYLHTATSRPIVHRNINCHNILLDEQCNPKLCDLAFSITIPVGETHVQMNSVAGTPTYIDPEYITSGILTEKSDVYSFGVVLLELLSGKIGNDLVMIYQDPSPSFRDFVIQAVLKEKRIELILDAKLSLEVSNMDQVIAYIELAARCIALEKEQRPSMKEVALELRRIKRYKHSSSS